MQTNLVSFNSYFWKWAIKISFVLSLFLGSEILSAQIPGSFTTDTFGPFCLYSSNFTYDGDVNSKPSYENQDGSLLVSWDGAKWIVGTGFEHASDTPFPPATGWTTLFGSGCNNPFAINAYGPDLSSGGDVPTLSEWGLIILALLFMTFGTLYLIQPQFNKLQKREA
ncbi:MAG: IPTL-CTERM sorting domain-containing protein [Chitinophagales bacterium]